MSATKDSSDYVLVKTVTKAGMCELVDYVPIGSNDTDNILPPHWLTDDLEERADKGSTGIPIHYSLSGVTSMGQEGKETTIKMPTYH